MLKIEHLTKSYNKNGRPAVDDLSLHIQPGEIYGFIGHNGAGKTTTLKACCGILRFDSGDIFVDGVSFRSDPMGCKSKLAYIPDNPDLYEFLTGIQYLNFIGDIYGVPAGDREQRIAEYAATLELTDALAQKISAYSHGMKQKLAVISAMGHTELSCKCMAEGGMVGIPALAAGGECRLAVSQELARVQQALQTDIRMRCIPGSRLETVLE